MRSGQYFLMVPLRPRPLRNALASFCASKIFANLLSGFQVGLDVTRYSISPSTLRDATHLMSLLGSFIVNQNSCLFIKRVLLVIWQGRLCGDDVLFIRLVQTSLLLCLQQQRIQTQLMSSMDCKIFASCECC